MASSVSANVTKASEIYVFSTPAGTDHMGRNVFSEKYCFLFFVASVVSF